MTIISSCWNRYINKAIYSFYSSTSIDCRLPSSRPFWGYSNEKKGPSLYLLWLKPNDWVDYNLHTGYIQVTKEYIKRSTLLATRSLENLSVGSDCLNWHVKNE